MIEAKRQLQGASHVAVLTGAGISAESGIPTFRGQDGLWKNYRAEDLANRAAYARDPLLVWEWYRLRFHTATAAKPNAAHKALARLEQRKQLSIITQNVDGLHQRAGSQRVLELHGNLMQSRCEACYQLDALSPDFSIPPHCSRCSSRARPNVVWFGENLPQTVFNRAIEAFAQAELAIVIGTSGVVEPAASLVRIAKQQDAYLIEVNPAETPLTFLADSFLQMTAVEAMELLEVS